MKGDVTLSAPQTLTRDSIIDLNGHTIEGALSSALFQVNGVKLTLKGEGTIKNSKRIADITNGGELLIENGTYRTGNEGFKAIGSGSKITMNGGKLYTRETAMNISTGAELVMNGGLIETVDNMGIGTNGTSGLGGNTITMNGGKINAHITSQNYEAIGVYIANNDTFVMNDGEIVANGGAGLCMRAGQVAIHGGTITAIGTAETSGKIADAPAMMGPSGVIYHESANYPGKAGMSLTIDGGTITGVTHSVEILSNEDVPNVHITGGTFDPPYHE